MYLANSKKHTDNILQLYYTYYTRNKYYLQTIVFLADFQVLITQNTIYILYKMSKLMFRNLKPKPNNKYFIKYFVKKK